MKNKLLLLAMLINAGVSAQRLPTGQPGQRILPTPKIQPLKPADLIVTEFSLVSAARNRATKNVQVVVRVTVKNNGAQQATGTVLKGSATKEMSIPWAVLDGLVKINKLGPGESATTTCTFVYGKGPVENLQRFYFRVRADALNDIAESDEQNNYSEGILIAL